MIKIRALEKSDLEQVHVLNNEREVMAYWFEEPYGSVDELERLYDKHIFDQSERRFVIEMAGDFVGVVELMEIDYIHRNCEIQIIVIKKYRGQGLAQQALRKGLDYAFRILNMHKVYLIVDVTNKAAVHIYKKLGFSIEGTMKDHFYTYGEYQNAYFMGILKDEIDFGTLEGPTV